MNLDDKVIVLEDKKYLVIEDVDFDNKKYLYLVNDADEGDTTFVELDGNNIFTIDPDLFMSEILPLFEEKFAKEE